MIFSYFKHYFITHFFFMLMTTWQFHLLNWQAVGPMWAISISFIYTVLLVWAFLQSHKLNLTYCLKSSPAFCFLFVCMIGQTQMYPSSISPSELFQGIMCNIHSVNPIIFRGLRYLKNHRNGDQDFIVKMGEGGV